MRVGRDRATGAFFVGHSAVPGVAGARHALIEARLPEHRPAPHRRPAAAPPAAHRAVPPATASPTRGRRPYETGGLAVTERPYQVLDATGRAHPRRFAFGVPTESVHWVTAAGIRPGVDSVTLGDADAIARAALSAADQAAAGSADPAVGRGGGSRDRYRLRPAVPAWAGTPAAGATVGDEALAAGHARRRGRAGPGPGRLGVVPDAAADGHHRRAARPSFDLRDWPWPSRGDGQPGGRAWSPALTARVARSTRRRRVRAPRLHQPGHPGHRRDAGRAPGSLAADRPTCADCADGAGRARRAHRDTPMAGRTLTQHAVPTTFGLKAAGWLPLVLDAADRLDGPPAAAGRARRRGRHPGRLPGVRRLRRRRPGGRRR